MGSDTVLGGERVGGELELRRPVAHQNQSVAPFRQLSRYLETYARASSRD